MAVAPLRWTVLLLVLSHFDGRQCIKFIHPYIHTQVINVLLCQYHPLRIHPFPHALTMSDVLRKAGGLSITFAPILAVYLLHSQFTLQVRSFLLSSLLELNLVT